MSLISAAHSVVHEVTRLLHGETITLHTASDISVEISDAVVSLPAVVVTHDDGPAERDGTLRLAAEHHADAKAAKTVTVRGSQWHILTVGDVYADSFRCEIALIDADHSNRFDLQEQQAEWT